MTGAEHYEAAEHLLERAKTEKGDHLRMAAQVHATLALAAATAATPTRLGKLKGYGNS